MTAFNAGGGGRLVLASWRGPRSISELEKPAAACARLSQPDVVNEPINLPAGPPDVPSEQRCPVAALTGAAVLRGMVLTKTVNFRPKRAVVFCCDFSSFSPPWLGEMTSCTSAHCCKGKVKVGRVTVPRRKVPILCQRLPVGWHLAPASARPTRTSRPQPAAGKFYFHGKSWWVRSSIINQFV